MKVNDFDVLIKRPNILNSISINDLEIETDTGWSDIVKIYKTDKYIKYTLILDDGTKLECADIHRVFTKTLNEVFVSSLKPNDEIYTKHGIQKVKEIIVHDVKENMYDISVDDKNHRYYTNDILSHNSTNMGIRTILLCNLLPGIRIATIVPRVDQLKTIADKYSEIDKAYRFKHTNNKFRDNLYYKEFPHKGGKISIMRLWYILTNADKLRGNTYDFIDFDEYQDFDDSLEPVIKATQSRSELRSVTYSGTSKTTDSALEARWLHSSRGLWRLTCPACRHDNYPTLNHGVLDMIQPKGLCCKKCGRLLNVREGHWDFESPELLESGQWGFHVPQVIVPANTENMNIWIDIYKNSKTMEPKFFYEEFLGEATEEGSKELTIQDLQNICVLGNINDLQKAAISRSPRKYQFLVGGVDWGGSDYNPATKTKESYTCHVILGITPSGGLDLVYSRTYAGMAYDDISNHIAETHKKFNCYAIGGDFGGSAVYVNEIKKLVDPLKVISFKYSKPNSAYLSIPPSSSNFGNLYSLNKTESITSLILDIKNVKVRAPEWSTSKTHLTQCLNLVRVPTESNVGFNEFKYSKAGNKPDDFLHALNYAVTLAKLLQGVPLFEDPAKQRMFANYIQYGSFGVPISHRKIPRPISG